MITDTAEIPDTAQGDTYLFPGEAYLSFRAAVLTAVRARWLPRNLGLAVDLSVPDPPAPDLPAADLPVPDLPVPDLPVPDLPAADLPAAASGVAADGLAAADAITDGIAATARLETLATGSAGAVLATGRSLSGHLAAEALASQIARVLRPGGRILACADSLVRGMAVLARQHRWAHLADAPRADVQLVPWPDGSITRCYDRDELAELFSGAGLTVRWIRSFTVFPPALVSQVLGQHPDQLPALVKAELRAARLWDIPGPQLLIAAEKPRSATGPAA